MEERGKKKRKQTPRLVDGVVCVAGGGIGGLGAALALQRRGVDVKVYERDASLLARPQGQVLCRSLADPAATDHVHIACALAGSRSTHACIWGGGRAVCKTYEPTVKCTPYVLTSSSRNASSPFVLANAKVRHDAIHHKHSAGRARVARRAPGERHGL